MKDKEDSPWAEVPDDMKVSILVDAVVERTTGDYALRAIEREVDYGISPGGGAGRTACEARTGRARWRESDPSYQDDNAGLALRLAEFEAVRG